MKGQPKALYMLSSTEMWERFSFYGMRAILVLYMIAKSQDAGLGWSHEYALRVYGMYTGFVWVTPLLGGFLADRFLGQQRAVLLGSVIIAMGHFFLAMPSLASFYTGLVCICLGTGFFKPCVTSLLGGLYEKNDVRRDAGYNIFYMGINVGSVLGSFLTGWLQVKYNFHYGFGAAGFGMMLALAIFMMAKSKYLGQVGSKPPKKVQELGRQKQALTKSEKSHIKLIMMIALLCVLYFIAYNQAGGLLTIFTQEMTNRTIGSFEIPTPWFEMLNPIFVVMLAPLCSSFWTYLEKKGKNPSIIAKLAVGFILTGLAFILLMPATFEAQAHPGIKVSMIWLILFYVLYTIAEMLVIPLVWSTVSRLAPARYLSILMAVVLASLGVGSYLAGLVGSYVTRLGGPGQIFAGLMIVMFAFGGLCLLLNRPLMVLSREEEVQPLVAST